MTAVTSSVSETVACTPERSSYAIGEDAAESVASALKALAEPLRLRFLSYIAATPGGEACVCDLEELADVTQPTVSHHLKVLKNAGVLESERRGTWVWYRIVPELQAAIATLLDAFAPATAAQTVHTSDAERLRDVDDRLVRVADELSNSFRGISGDLVLRVVRESYTSLARNAAATTHLTTLAERFARQRLADISRSRENGPPQVLFVCFANAGRSQLAAALVTHVSRGRVTARSAGSTPGRDIHPSVKPMIAKLDAGAAREMFPKPLTDDAVRAADVVVTMGCGDVCPVIPGIRYEDWAVGDPALASAEGAAAIRDDIAGRVRVLLNDLVPHLIPENTGVV
ncbi:metalloregulator ArsR/SmtB family transcription factor [Paramicrobacterium fandaimingii]|uniref:metalloregulator ArsR/SmtB family transcription factor n=1 Tax=Paramicrobacterium fandaimingii TaxID=2708079 RepID=UPI00141EC834|nr:metalloregulator ArsR/SmtB family transcription factor [Microbacterium fandaimingii]